MPSLERTRTKASPRLDSVSQGTQLEETAEARITQARCEVALSEKGEVLNEHYCYGDYVRRRANFLGSLRGYRWQNAMAFESARRSARQVFDCDGSDALSVQEVRRREERFEEFPLLPLPTKSNTQTINDFLDYPYEEWTPPRTPEAYASSLSPFRPGAVTPTKINSAGPSTVTTPGPQPPLRDQVSSPATAFLEAANGKILSTSQNASITNNPAPLPDANQSSTAIQMEIPLSTAVQMTSVSPFEGSESWRPSTASSALQAMSTEELLQTPPSRWDSAQPESAQVKTSLDTYNDQVSNLSIQKDKPAQGRQGRPPILPPGVLISAYASRGTSVPVKSQTRSKRSRSDNPDEEVSFEKDSESIDKPVTTPSGNPKSKVPQAAAVRRTKRKQPMDENKEAADRVIGASTAQPLSKKQKKVISLEDVIHGRSLPESAEQARAASTELRARLLKEHNTHQQQQTRGTARRVRTRNTEPDLMPEFFNVRNFPRSKRDETVRCVCGQTDDDGQHMLSCDRCSVWEHTACVGGAAPKDLENIAAATYLCRICDPWRHRVQLKKLRAGEPLQ